MIIEVMILLWVIKKDRISQTILLFSALIILIVCGLLHNRDDSQPVSALPVANKVVVLDAGHGGFDAGASDNGVIEKEVNLDVTLRLKEYLEQGGCTVILTRAEDVSTAREGTNGTSAKKDDLVQRKNLANSSGADIFVSIHMNKFGQAQYKGAQVFYSEKPEEGKMLGEEIEQALKDVLKDGNQRVAKKIDGGVFIMKNTTIPSVIVECGFLSNPQEAELLKTDEYRQKLAWGVYIGIMKYFNN